MLATLLVDQAGLLREPQFGTNLAVAALQPFGPQRCGLAQLQRERGTGVDERASSSGFR
jgi:hypothetical protein